MRRFMFLASIILTLTVFAPPLQAHMAGKGDFQITHPWAKPSDKDTTAAYPTLSNDGETAVVIRAVATPVAKRVKLFLREAAAAELVVPAGEVFGPDELCLQLIGLNRPLKKGDHFPMTLTLANGDEIEFHVVVGEDTVMPQLKMGQEN
ncbi:MAG: copper chaperone PCu(A)C [Alphaproteobacteria bacterium]|nr:copper chaperone PCu(A)C [Alphaproteobacteria bacterium]